ncbi:hypothetical protein LCGC14_0412020, partial [marine sediment metagenome]
MTASAIKKMKAKIAELKKELVRITELRLAEQKGRWTAEQKLREAKTEINSATLEVKRAKISLDQMSRLLDTERFRVGEKLKEIETIKTGFRQFIAVQITDPDHRLSL